MAFRVSADIRYLDGTLAGIDIPAGHAVTMPTRSLAEGVFVWLSRVQRENDFIRAVGGNRYAVTGHVEMIEVGPHA